MCVKINGSMTSVPVALQLYSLRDTSKTSFQQALQDAANAGYTAIEFAGFGSHSASEIRAMLDELGLRCAGAHTGLPSIQGEELKKTAEFLAEVGSPFLIVPGVPAEYRGTREGALKLARELASAAESASQFGARVGYHNHDWELESVGDAGSETPLQIIAQNTPDSVIIQFDTGNAQEVGANPVEWIEKWGHRMTTLHLKPFVRNREQEFERYFIGEDDSDWQGILAAIKPENTQFAIVEQERYPLELSPAECVARCFNNLKSM